MSVHHYFNYYSYSFIYHSKLVHNDGEHRHAAFMHRPVAHLIYYIRETTFSNGSLGSCSDEERSETRNVVWIAEFVNHWVFERILHCLELQTVCLIEYRFNLLDFCTMHTTLISNGKCTECVCVVSKSEMSANVSTFNRLTFRSNFSRLNTVM